MAKKAAAAEPEAEVSPPMEPTSLHENAPVPTVEAPPDESEPSPEPQAEAPSE